eukprot:NODE_2416_length_1069_cov_251.435244_g2398_i0.p1 GENE.NODE_2416_length_1069_cov_251.435244_g2398_i0~~NODE_2416_length_1069_cov_251.435244_g2398_i0.p1  ORF type:complete len:310 (+),score=62.91 NODE_2416_length_1069_cov_251.435244_g2398_i0:61-930(+)
MKLVCAVLVAVCTVGSLASRVCECQQTAADKDNNCKGHGCYTAKNPTQLLTVFHPEDDWDPNEDFGDDWQIRSTTELIAMGGKWLCTIPNTQDNCPALTVENGVTQSCANTPATRCTVDCDLGYYPMNCEAGPVCLSGKYTPFECLQRGRRLTPSTSSDASWDYHNGAYSSLVGGDQTYLGKLDWGNFCACKTLEIGVSGGGSPQCGGDSKWVRVRRHSTEQVLWEASLNTALGGKNVDLNSEQTLFINTTAWEGEELYVEFEDSDNNANGCGYAFVGFEPSMMTTDDC